MRKLMILTIFVISAAGWGHAQNMPPEVRAFLDNYTNDSTAQFGPIDARNSGLFSSDSVQIKDLRLRAVEVYEFKHIYLNSYPDTVPLSELIETANHWRVLVTAHDKLLYELRIRIEQGTFSCYAMAYFNSDCDTHCTMWEQLLKLYPESTGINPVFFSRLGYYFNATECFLYFGQVGYRRIFYIKPGRSNDELEPLFSSSMEALDDSKKLMKYWKERGIDEVGRRYAEPETPTQILKTERSKR